MGWVTLPNPLFRGLVGVWRFAPGLGDVVPLGVGRDGRGLLIVLAPFELRLCQQGLKRHLQGLWVVLVVGASEFHVAPHVFDRPSLPANWREKENNQSRQNI